MKRSRPRTRVPAEAAAGSPGTGTQEKGMAEDQGSQEGTVPSAPQDDHLKQARALAAAGDLDAAVDLYREVVLMGGGGAGARLELGRLHASREEHHLALEQFESARTAEPENVEAMEAVAVALAAVGRFETAEKELRRILRLHPEHASAHGHLGMVSFRRGLYAQAEMELKRALELDPELATAYFYRGEALNQLGRSDEALEMLERSVQLNPANARAFYIMGIVYDKKGRPQEAGAMYRKAREVAAG